MGYYLSSDQKDSQAMETAASAEGNRLKPAVGVPIIWLPETGGESRSQAGWINIGVHGDSALT